jgi:uncharacterized protein (DUF2252 family)
VTEAIDNKTPAHGAHRTPEERAARGKAARSEVPRSSQGAYESASDRPDPIDLLGQQAKTRVGELVPLRYGRMLVSPFAFYRGAAKIMAHDLAGTPRSGITVQCCGDAHVSNFGLFASPERRLVFDINDFDETLPGPWEWDLKRLVASILIAARDNGFGAADQERIVVATAAQYRGAMREFAAMTNLEVWYAHLDVDRVLEAGTLAGTGERIRPEGVKLTEKTAAKARTRDSMSAFTKLTYLADDGQRRIVDQSPLVVPIDVMTAGDDREELLGLLRGLMGVYRDTLDFDRRALIDQFELVDFARKVVGVGSVGTRAWIALLLGRDVNDPLFLQIKEAEASVFEDVLGAGEFSNHGQRVVIGQRRMQAVGDILLGWVEATSPLDGKSRAFYVRQLRDWKGSVEIDQMTPKLLRGYGTLCGWTLARAHARTGDRIAIASYLGGSDRFDRAMLEFALAYAEQNDSDYQRLVDAVESGRITAETGI